MHGPFQNVYKFVRAVVGEQLESMQVRSRQVPRKLKEKSRGSRVAVQSNNSFLKNLFYKSINCNVFLLLAVNLRDCATM